LDTLTRMQAYLEVVDSEGFSAAARKLGRSKALMSKYVRELEDELGILLLNRTTRQFSMTEAGEIYYQSAAEILQKVGDLQDTVRETGNGLKGRLRISAPRSLTDLEIGLPIVEFSAEYPELTLDINLDDKMVDMVEDGFDVAIRISRLADSALIARRLAGFELVLCATPKFVKQHGKPASPQDLVKFPCVVDTNNKRRNNWCFLGDDGKEISVAVKGTIEVNSPEVARRAALAGLGITLVPEFSIVNELKSGELVSLLDNRLAKSGGIYAVFPHRRHVPAKVRVFVDFLVKRKNALNAETGNNPLASNSASKSKAMHRSDAPVASGRVGLLLVNLGTPDGYDAKSVRRYLAEFLSDRRVIDKPRWSWYPILYGVILNTRPKKSGAAYKTIWNEALDESPLRTFTRSQAEKLGASLNKEKKLVVDWAMRYGSPSITSRLNALKEQGCDRIVVLPLYPQYCAATTASVCDKVFQSLQAMRWMPAIRIVPAYPDEPAYIRALADSIKSGLSKLKTKPAKIIASYHGIPKSHVEKGDPYYRHCLETSQALRQQLGMDEDMLITTFQSRFGREEWLQPYTDKTIEALAQDGVRDIVVLTPGFVSDCLETLEEIAIEAAETFHRYGGENFTYIPCLNDSVAGMKVIEDLVKRELGGWLKM